jgi:hypothetical protein
MVVMKDECHYSIKRYKTDSKAKIHGIAVEESIHRELTIHIYIPW